MCACWSPCFLLKPATNTRCHIHVSITLVRPPCQAPMIPWFVMNSSRRNWIMKLNWDLLLEKQFLVTLKPRMRINTSEVGSLLLKVVYEFSFYFVILWRDWTCMFHAELTVGRRVVQRIHCGP